MKSVFVFIKLFSLLLLAALVLFTMLLFKTDYPFLILFLKNAHPGIYDSEKIDVCFTENRFLIARYALLGSSIIFFLTRVYLWNKINKAAEAVYEFYKGIKQLVGKIAAVYMNLKTSEKILVGLLFAITIIHKLLKLYEFPFEVDEVFSYVFFVSEDFWVPAVYYPEPNNHILYNLICSVCDLFISDPVLVMRLPSFIIFLVFITILFAFLKHTFNFQTAIFATALSAFSHPIIFYSLQGRGYLLMSLCVILAAFAMFKMVSSKEKSIYRIIFILSSIAGAYTIPVFLIPFSGIVVFGFISTWTGNRTLVRPIFFSVAIIASIVLLLYLPIILFNGTEALAGNKWVRSRDLAYFVRIFPVATAESIDYILNVENKGYLIAMGFFILLGFVFFKIKDKSDARRKWIILFFVFLITAGLMLFILRVFPPYRVWIYFIFIYHITLSILVSSLLDFIPYRNLKRVILMMMYAGIVFSGMATPPSLAFEKSFYGELDKKINYIYQKKPSGIFIDRHDFFEHYLKLKYKIEKKKIKITVGSQHPTEKYQFLILYQLKTPNETPPPGYRRKFICDDAVVFELDTPGS